MTSLTSLIAYALAVGAVVDVVRNGSILAGLRARIEAGPEGLFKDLLGCPFCLTYQAALWLTVLTAAAGRWSFDLIVVALAAARVSWIVNGLLPSRLRYDREPEL